MNALENNTVWAMRVKWWKAKPVALSITDACLSVYNKEVFIYINLPRMYQSCIRFAHVLLLVVVLQLGWGADWARGSVVGGVSAEFATARLQKIAEDMKFIRFCSRATCQFKDIKVEVTSSDNNPEQLLGRIDAVMDRPSTMLDLAHYNFLFDGDRWTLLGGEELSDVSSFTFDDDSYTVYSSYSGRSRTSKLDSADSNLRVGYRDLYYQTLDRGAERL